MTSLIPDLIEINDDFGSEDNAWEEQESDLKKKRGRQKKIKNEYDGGALFREPL